MRVRKPIGLTKSSWDLVVRQNVDEKLSSSNNRDTLRVANVLTLRAGGGESSTSTESRDSGTRRQNPELRGPRAVHPGSTTHHAMWTAKHEICPMKFTQTTRKSSYRGY